MLCLTAQKREVTAQGFEKQIGVNHFGHFHLTSKLMGLVAQPGSRVVVLSSVAHSMGRVVPEDLHFEASGKYNPPPSPRPRPC